jgi:hypothetical protein
MVLLRLLTTFDKIKLIKAGIAQLVEQRIENSRVTSSNLVPGNNN